jgi:hypothetical protein
VGRHVFGVASVLLGIASLALRDQLTSDWQLPGDMAFLIVASAAQIIGGIAIQFRRTQAPAAVLLGAVYLIFGLTWLPGVVTQPAVYATWGNVFYRLASVSGAVVAYFLATPATPRAQPIIKAAVMLQGLCYLSFAAEQMEFLTHTADLVPKWVPGGGMVWAIVTTVAFGLAGVSLLSGFKALVASWLATFMLVVFVPLIWIPTLIADPKTHSNWSEGLETLLIAGAGWIVADFLNHERLAAHTNRQPLHP